MLQFMRSQGIGHDLVTKKQQSSRSSQSCLLSAHTSSTSSLVNAHLTLCSRHTEILAVSACLIHAVCSASNAFDPSFLMLTPFHSSGLGLPVTWLSKAGEFTLLLGRELYFPSSLTGHSWTSCLGNPLPPHS